MKRVIKKSNVCGTEEKYILKEEYNGFGIYQHKTPSGFFTHQHWLISNNNSIELVVESYNNICEEELLNIIDNYNTFSKFGVKALVHCGILHMHPNGKVV